MATAWNKGLTRDDPRVAKYHKKGVETRKNNGSYVANSGTFEKGQTRGRYPKGRPNHKLSRVRKEMFKNGKLKPKMAGDNPSWKGDNVSLSSLHQWVSTRRKTDGKCEHCGADELLDLSSNGHTYTRNPNDWEWLCRKCHRTKDKKLRS